MNQQNVFICLERAIDGLYRGLMAVTLLGVLSLLNQQISALSDKFFFCLLMVLFILYLTYIFLPQNYYQQLFYYGKRLFKRFGQLFEGKSIGFIFLILFVIQLILVVTLSGYTDWDVGGVFEYTKQLMQDNDGTKINEYLSKNPNNAFFFFMMYGWSYFGNLLSPGLGNEWYFWQFLNILVIDIGIFILYFIARDHFTKKTGVIAVILAILTLGFSGWILVPYTDTFSFTLTAIFLYFLFKKDNDQLYYPILLGILLSIGYLIKPSLIIPYIAFIIIRLFTAKIQIKKLLITIICFMMGIFTYQYQLANQTIIQLDHDQGKPWALFVMMGLKDDGGYNYEDTIYIRNAGDTEAGNELALQVIQERLEDYGLTSYSKFLWNKQQYNTRSGTFSMGADGSGLIAMEKPKNSIRQYLRSIYFPDGSRHHIGQFVGQIIWFGVIVAALCVPLQGKKLSFLKLTLIGLFIFLLIFEAGRSRYLIQQLPTFLLLSSQGIEWISHRYNQFLWQK